MKFIDECMLDFSHRHKIDEYIDLWNWDESILELLHEYLGLTAEEFDSYCKNHDNLFFIILKRKIFYIFKNLFKNKK